MRGVFLEKTRKRSATSILIYHGAGGRAKKKSAFGREQWKKRGPPALQDAESRAEGGRGQFKKSGKKLLFTLFKVEGQ